MKRVIVQILPVGEPSPAKQMVSTDDSSPRPELLPINGGLLSPNGSERDEDVGVRVEAIVSSERARAVVDTVLNVNELASLDSFDRMVDLLVQRELANDDSGQLFHRVMSCVEKALVEKAFFDCGQVQTRTAERLGVNRNTIHKKLLKHELLDPDDGMVLEETPDQLIEKRKCI